LGLTTLFHSCIGDGLEVCPVDNKILVYFNYQKAERVTTRADSIGVVKGIEDEDAAAVTQIDLYVFDANTNLFVDKFTDLSPNLNEKDVYCMTISIPAGKYKFVAWGGMKKTDFAVSPVTPVKGGSAFSDFSVNYLFHGDTINADIENLFYGVSVDEYGLPMENVRITGADTVHIDLRQDTYTFNITMTGTALKQESDYQAVITDNNSYFDFDNTLVSAPSHNYKAAFEYRSFVQPETWVASRTTLQIDRDRKPMLRFFRDGYPWVINGMVDGYDLVYLLLQYEKSGIYIKFEEMYVFDIRFVVNGDPDDSSSISVGVEIGEWRISMEDDSPLIHL
jgi:hypothetical protein